jgi:hypothetical protein
MSGIWIVIRTPWKTIEILGVHMLELARSVNELERQFQSFYSALERHKRMARKAWLDRFVSSMLLYKLWELDQ